MQKKIDEYLFQNISCYCLTDERKGRYYYLKLFQNISCYCLTGQTPEEEKKNTLFQNISCYCLTNDFTSFFNGLF